MPKPVSWIVRLAEIRRSVENSVKTHYSRRDLEILFRVQARTALNLMDLMSKEKLTNAGIVPREVLGRFLEEVAEEDDTSAVMARRREAQIAVSRRRPRKLNLSDIEWVNMDALPSSVRLERGRLEIRFERTEDLVKGLWQIAAILQADMDRFIDRFEPVKHREPDPAKAEVARMFADLEQREAVSRAS